MESTAVVFALLAVPWSAASNAASAHLGAGLKLFDVQRYSEAAKEFKLALDADAGLQDARYHLAVCDFNQRQFPEAREQFGRLAGTGYEKRWVTYYLGRLDLLDGELDSAIQRFGSLTKSEPLQDESYYLGSALMKKGEPAKAISPLAKQIEINPRDFRAHDLIARAYMKVGRSKDAEREFQIAGELREYYGQGKKQLADCQTEVQAGRVDSAWAGCKPFLQSDDIDLLVAAGMMFGQAGYHDQALQFFQHAVELDPDSPEINYDAGLTLFWMKDYASARKYIAAALAVRPDFFEALATQGAILYMLKEDAAAREILERAHGLRPDDSAVNKLLSQLNTQPAK
jgi:tetratricopeptide (TPR) repeat protein